MRIKRIIIGVLIGVVIGLGLEYVNSFMAFLMPPFFFFLPSTVIIGGCIGALSGYSRLIAYLGVVACIILGGILGLITLVLGLAAVRAEISVVHLGVGIALGAFLGAVLAVIRVRRYLRKQREKQLVKYLALVPENAGDFISAVIEKMRYRKDVSHDVAAEIAAHFEDELKECTIDEEKEQKAQQLIGQFGDVKLLAILLRRAKKRCRPLWRTVVARTFQTVGILILCLIIYVVWFLTGKPNISVDYLAIINQMNRPQLAEEDNGWPHYEKAIELFVEVSEELKKMDVFKNYKDLRAFGELTEEEKEEIKKWVQQNESAWREFVAGSSKAYCYRQAEYNNEDKEKWLWNILLPELGTLRNLSRLGIWRSKIAVERGLVKEGLENCLVVIRTGRFWQEHKLFIVEQLVGMAYSNLGHNEILRILEDEDIYTDDLRWLQGQLSQIYADGYPLMDIEGEKLAFMDIVQHTFTDGGPGGGHLIPERMAWMQRNLLDRSRKEEVGETLLFAGPAMYHVSRDKTVRKANKIYGKIAEIAKMTPYQRHITDLEDKFERMLVENRWRYALVSIFVPAFNRASEQAFCAKALHEATIAVSAIKRWQLKKGVYPDSLEQLVSAGYLKKLPMDPFSDGVLVYKKMDDNFILYSIGANFIDDGGSRYSEYPWGGYNKGDRVFWPVEKYDECEKRLERERRERWKKEREERRASFEGLKSKTKALHR